MNHVRETIRREILSFFQSSSTIRPYQLHSHADYLQLPTESIVPLSRITVARQSGPDVGLRDIAQRPTKEQIPVADQSDWQEPNEQYAYGLSTSLYDRNPLTGEQNGDPVADCFAICAHQNNAILMIADGVNWGYKARLAARCAIHAAMECLSHQLFEHKIQTTKDLFACIRMAIDAAQRLILDREGTLSTLTISIVCQSRERWFVCSAIVGDSNAYVYSPRRNSVLELTEGSRDLNNERDMRVTDGALGTTMTEQADVSNLTYSIMSIEGGDFVFLTTDGISDNYDPCVSRLATNIRSCERHRDALDQMQRTIENDGSALSAVGLCHRLVDQVVRVTDEQRRTIEEECRENQGLTGLAKRQFEIDMLEKVKKTPGKLDHASIVAYQITS